MATISSDPDTINPTADVPAFQPDRRALLTDADGLFARQCNRESFMFAHALKNHPLFELSSLVELSRRLPAHPDFAYWSNGKVSVTDPWEKGMSERYSLQDTIRNIAGNNSIVILKHAEQDPVYGPVLQALLSAFVDYSGPAIGDDVTIGEALILVSSPNRVTPYHFDSELNFLVQVVGDKTLNVFDHTTARQVDQLELEGYFSGAPSSAVYSEAKQRQATVYDLRAGWGVHIPVVAPHWVQNRDNISVALSINYELRSVGRLARTHSFNRRLRRLGLRPAMPGVSPVGDRLKPAGDWLLTKLRNVVKPAPKPISYSVWTPPPRR